MICVNAKIYICVNINWDLPNEIYKLNTMKTKRKMMDHYELME